MYTSSLPKESAAQKQFGVSGLFRFRVWGLGCGVWGLGFRVQGSGLGFGV